MVNVKFSVELNHRRVHMYNSRKLTYRKVTKQFVIRHVWQGLLKVNPKETKAYFLDTLKAICFFTTRANTPTIYAARFQVRFAIFIKPNIVLLLYYFTREVQQKL